MLAPIQFESFASGPLLTGGGRTIASALCADMQAMQSPGGLQRLTFKAVLRQFSTMSLNIAGVAASTLNTCPHINKSLQRCAPSMKHTWRRRHGLSAERRSFIAPRAFVNAVSISRRHKRITSLTSVLAKNMNPI